LLFLPPYRPLLLEDLIALVADESALDRRRDDPDELTLG